MRLFAFTVCMEAGAFWPMVTRILGGIYMHKAYKGWTIICLLMGALLCMAQSCELTCTDNDGDGYAVEGDNCGMVDCDDTDADINPDADEICDDGIDNNCDGETDEGCAAGDDDDNATTTTTTVDPCADGTIGETPCESSRFADNCDGTVTDCVTGLVWLKVATCLGSMDWDAAPGAVAALGEGDCGFEGTLLDGSSPGDWRMPTKEEMQGLGTNPPTTWESGYPPVPWTLAGGTTLTPFLYVQSNNFWTSTVDAVDTDNAWVLSSGDGAVFIREKTAYTYYVWPVHRGND
jgi:hypothetical protein